MAANCYYQRITGKALHFNSKNKIKLVLKEFKPADACPIYKRGKQGDYSMDGPTFSGNIIVRFPGTVEGFCNAIRTIIAFTHKEAIESKSAQCIVNRAQ